MACFQFATLSLFSYPKMMSSCAWLTIFKVKCSSIRVKIGRKCNATQSTVRLDLTGVISDVSQLMKGEEWQQAHVFVQPHNVIKDTFCLCSDVQKLNLLLAHWLLNFLHKPSKFCCTFTFSFIVRLIHSVYSDCMTSVFKTLLWTESTLYDF